ncbi:MAG: hypothetical protein ACJ73N_10865 [Bryobacteraceae bacterium]
MISRAISTTLFVYFLLASALAAPVGAIKGYIKDPSGGAVVNADLVLTDEKTGVQPKLLRTQTGFTNFLT